MILSQLVLGQSLQEFVIAVMMGNMALLEVVWLICSAFEVVLGSRLPGYPFHQNFNAYRSVWTDCPERRWGEHVPRVLGPLCT